MALLTAGLGQSHVVVGQGLVDAALSLRAEERRGLFEHAADLSGLRLKVAEAERNLAETDANTARLSDLLIELEPRLKSLERAARQATEWQSLRDRLRDVQGAHYREALETATAGSPAAEIEAENAARAVDRAHEDVVKLVAAGERATTRLTAARERAGAEHDEQRATLEDRLRRQTHERDLAAARIEALSKRRADMEDAREGLDERVVSVSAELSRLQSDLRDLERATTESRDAAARHHRDVTARREARGAIEARLAGASRELVETARLEANWRGSERFLSSAALHLTVSMNACAAPLRTAKHGSRHSRPTPHMAAPPPPLTTSGAPRSMRDSRTSNDLETATQHATSMRAEVDRLHRALGEAVTRLEVLRRMHESGAGLHAGVREVLTAGRDGRLKGIRGTMAELLVVAREISRSRHRSRAGEPPSGSGGGRHGRTPRWPSPI